VLYDLREYHRWPFLLRRMGLLLVNAIFIGLGLATFVCCFVYRSLSAFSNSTLYQVMYWVQVVCQIVVTSLMLHLGLKLSERIKGATADQDPKASSPFKRAVDRLNFVMGSCLACVALQCTLLVLNYILSDPTTTTSFLMPPIAYWALEYWIPQTGWCTALLYLCRNPPVKHPPELPLALPITMSPVHASAPGSRAEDELTLDARVQSSLPYNLSEFDDEIVHEINEVWPRLLRNCAHFM
jgi:hypothetical protein